MSNDDVTPAESPRALRARVRRIEKLEDATGGEIGVEVPKDLIASLGTTYAAVQPKHNCNTCYGRGYQRHVKPGTNDGIEVPCNCLMRVLYLAAQR